VAPTPPSTPSPPPHFVVDGTVEAWDSLTRSLRLQHDDHRFVAAPTITGTIPPKGRRVTVSGHVDADGRWVVTGLSARP
jgi:hypothetical protein